MTKEEMQSSIEKLSELRAKYNCFDEKEEPFYHALSLGIKGIKVVEQESILDKIRNEIEQIAKDYDKFDDHRRKRGLWIAIDIIDKYKAESEDKV